MKKVVDEREELELLKIDRKGFWCLFYGLVIISTLKLIFPECDYITSYGVHILLYISAGIVLFGCAKKGLWCYTVKPTNFSNALCSVVGSILCSIIVFLVTEKYYEGQEGRLVMYCIVFAVVMFLLGFGALTLMKKIVLNRKKKLEESFEDDFNDN